MKKSDYTERKQYLEDTYQNDPASLHSVIYSAEPLEEFLYIVDLIARNKEIPCQLELLYPHDPEEDKVVATFESQNDHDSVFEAAAEHLQHTEYQKVIPSKDKVIIADFPTYE